MTARMEIVDIREHDARMTGHGAIYETNEQTLAVFNATRALSVPEERAEFMLDYYSDEDTLEDTILLDADGFTALVNEAPKSHAYYRTLDTHYWQLRFTVGHSEAIKAARLEAGRLALS